MSLNDIKLEYGKFLMPIIKESCKNSNINVDDSFNFCNIYSMVTQVLFITMSLFIEELLNNNFKLLKTKYSEILIILIIN